MTLEELVDSIDKRDIIKLEHISHAVQEANNGEYQTIIINKLDEFVEIAHQVKPKCIFVTHNSMDPVNSKLIQHNKHFNKILTINHYHNSLLYYHTVNIPVSRYLNYDTYKKSQIKSRDKMKYTITFIGRISDEKNLLLLLDAFCQYNNTTHQKLKLNVIGDGKSDISLYEHNKYINFVGRANYNQIMYYLANSDYLISTSCTEGLPFVFLEAMSIGIPVISSNIIGCNEIVSEGKTGLLFNFKHYNYNKNSMDLTNNKWSIFDVISRNIQDNIINIVNTLTRAYNISIIEWTQMSNNCYQYYNDNFNPKLSMKNNVDNIINNNRIAIQCTDCNPYFVNIFKNIDIVENIDPHRTYDIILKLNSFDIFCERLSLLFNNKFSSNNCNKMGKSLSRLYRLRKEMLDNGIGSLTDGKNQLIIGRGSHLNITDIRQYI
jgi:glycosyltransferase involved in cell wall biosynthesis